jgi:hypothetical protein
MVLINLIPIIGWIWAIIELFFLRGTPGPNVYGPDPLAPRTYRPQVLSSPDQLAARINEVDPDNENLSTPVADQSPAPESFALPSVPFLSEQDRKHIYCEFLSTLVASSQEQPPPPETCDQPSQQALTLARQAIAAKHSLSDELLTDIEHEGETKRWAMPT